MYLWSRFEKNRFNADLSENMVTGAATKKIPSGKPEARSIINPNTNDMMRGFFFE